MLWEDLERTARTWLVARRESVRSLERAEVTIVHLAPLRAPSAASQGSAAEQRDPATKEVDSAYLASVIECLDTGVFVLDADLSLVLMNAALRDMHGHGGSLTGAGWPGRPDVVHADGSPLADGDRLVALTMRLGELRGLRRAIRNDRTGQLRQVSVNGRTVAGRDGVFAGLAFAVHDVDDAVAAQQELRRLAEHDQLTGVLNRRGLKAALELESPGAVGNSPQFVLLVDVDHFKAINDDFGHAAGDDVLRRVAMALLAAAGPDCLVARLGGDEFIIVGWDEARHLDGSLRLAMTEVSSPDGSRPINVTTGRAERIEDGETFERLAERADEAMYARRRRRRLL